VSELWHFVFENDAKGVRDGLWDSEQLNELDSNGRTPLIVAAILGYHLVCRALREKGADIDIKDPTGRNAVDYAAKYGHGLCIIALIKGGSGG